MMRRLCAVVLFVLLGSLAATGFADASQVLLGFGDGYTRSDGRSVIHRGVDVAASESAHICAPIAGTVRFAGRVPGADGGTVLCVSLDTAAGIVSILPLAGYDVSRGDTVQRGMTIGALAADGDGSSSTTHVHLGLRVGEEYADPSALVAGLILDSEDDAQSVPEATPAPAPAPQPAPAAPAVGVIAPEPVTDSAPQPSSGEAPEVSYAEPPTVEQPDMPGSTSGAPLPEAHPISAPIEDVGAHGRANPVNGRSGAGSPVARLSTAPVGRAGSVHLNAKRTARSGEGAADSYRVLGPRVSSAMGTVSGALGLLAGQARDEATSRSALVVASLLAVAAVILSYLGSIVFTAGLVRRYRAPVVQSSRPGLWLQHPGAGDRLRGLTSCSGPTAFTVPGPLAQRR